MKKLIVLSICVVLVFGLSFTSSAMASDEDDVLQALENSFKALNSSDASTLSSLWWHSEDISAFGPGSSGAFLSRGWDEIDKGNKMVTSLPLSFSIHNPQVTMLGDSVAFTTAYIIAVYTDPETQAQIVQQARQTVVYKKIDGKWLIVHGHGSMLPTE